MSSASLALYTILSNDKDMINGFIPTEGQLNRLRLFKEYIDFGSLSGMEWFQIMTEYPMLFSMCNNPTCVWEDQLERARHIAWYMVYNNMHVLRTMDGHGRFLYSFFHALVELRQNIDDYTVELIDIDETTNEWHIEFCPTNVEVEPTKSILEDSDPEFLAGANTHDDRPRLLYLNYCSIPDEELVDVTDTVMNNLYNGIRLYVSYSVRNVNKHTMKGRTYRKYKKFGQVVSKRGNFVTMCF